MKSYFITGTNTDCGKTYVTCQMLKALKKKLIKAMAIKPLATGCFDQDGVLVSEDALLIQQQNINQDMAICKWRFLPPVSPHIAAKEANLRITAQAIVDYCLEKPFLNHDLLLVEGAGGLMVPFNEQETWIDFLTISQFPVILVVGMRLGCINHALLTDAVLQSYGIPCVGWVANCIDKDMLYLNENIATLEEKMHMPLLATIPYGSQNEDLFDKDLL